MRHRPPAVEEPRHRVREQRAAGRRPGDDLRLLDEVRRHHVDQVLRDPPDRRRKLEQLVRIQIQPAVEAIAVIEVAFHDHLEALEVLEGAGANLVMPRVAGRVSSSQETLTAGFA